jgi:hypothetical protein
MMHEAKVVAVTDSMSEVRSGKTKKWSLKEAERWREEVSLGGGGGEREEEEE